MLVQFLANKDGISCDMLVDHQIVAVEIPYVPKKLADHRGVALHLFLKSEGLKFNAVELEEKDEVAITKGFQYMENPIYVVEAIRRKTKTKHFSF